MSNQVGFSFQGDVFAGGNLIHSASGRLLKAMSDGGIDGGIDAYSVLAIIWLGKSLPIQPHHEISIRRQFLERKGTSGFLAKALSIGWGYSDIPLEISKTRAGTAALLTLGAFTTGDISDYTTAQCLQILMRDFGCESDMLPNLDVLKTLVAHISPFMYNSGFSKVFSHVSVVAKHRLHQAGWQENCRYLLSQGDPEFWVGAVRQLILTSERDEIFYLFAPYRATWLASYAAFVLGMSVKLWYDEILLWETVGKHGSVVIQTDKQATHKDMMAKSRNLLSLQPFGSKIPLQLNFPLKNALTLELELKQNLSRLMIEDVHRYIAELSYTIFNEISIEVQRGYKRETIGLPNIRCPINGNFALKHQALFRALIDIGLADTKLNGIKISELAVSTMATNMKPARISTTYGSKWGSQALEDIASNFATTAVALSQCTYDPEDLYVREDVTAGTRTSPWTEKIVRALKDHKSKTLNIPMEDSLKHLAWMLDGSTTHDSVIYDEGMSAKHNLLALSTSTVSIYYKAIVDAEAFNKQGQILAISPGRITLNGSSRLAVKDMNYKINRHTINVLESAMSKLACNTAIRPHFADYGCSLQMETSLHEQYIGLDTYMSLLNQGGTHKCIVGLPLATCMASILQAIVVDSCKHDGDRPLTIKKSLGDAYVGALGSKWPVPGSSKDLQTVFYALKHHSLEQMAQYQLCMLYLEDEFLNRPKEPDSYHSDSWGFDDYQYELLHDYTRHSAVLQTDGCLQCAYERHPLAYKGSVAVIMSG